MSAILVLGGGIVGRACAWDLTRRGHDVTVADRDPAAAAGVDRFVRLDVEDASAVHTALAGHDLMVAATHYRHGLDLAATAVAAGCHYLDFGGNPTVVKRQLALDRAARRAGVAVVPDCGLAPGIANVLADELIARLGGGGVDEVQLRVGALPQEPHGVLGYQLAFAPAGLINEYDEPCEVLVAGRPATVEPLTRFEKVPWERWGPLEAFATAGGTSTMCAVHGGAVRDLEYKTLRYPGHGAVFRAMRDLGLFSEERSDHDGALVAPRTVLLDALARHLPRGAPDVVLVRIWARRGTTVVGWEIEDVADGRFSALARTTAFPAAALADLLVRGDAEVRGARTMHQAVAAVPLLAALEGVGLTARSWAP